MAGAKGKRLTDFLAGGLVPAVEAAETAALKPAEDRRAAAAVLKSALTGVRVVPAAGKPSAKAGKAKAR
jgi:hypothetical protein